MQYGPIAYYTIRWRRDDSDGEWLYKNFPVNTRKFSIGPLQKGRDYVIEARSVGPTGLVSIWVDISHSVAGNAPLGTPTGLVATGAADCIRLDWTFPYSIGGGLLFCVERGTTSTGPFTEVARVSALHAILTERANNTYYYRVRSTNYDGEFSSYSSVVSGNPITTVEIMQQLADISSDSVLTPVEKKIVLRDYNWFIPEQSDLDGQATLYGITTEKTTYDTAMTALTTYLATLTTPVLWSNLTGNTTVVGSTFRSKWNDMLVGRYRLITKIMSTSKTLISAAQAAATAAQTDATNALGQLTDYSNDARLMPGEKWAVIRDVNAINGEVAGLDAKATTFAITTEKTSYDAAVSALNTYLATLTTPVLWSNKTGSTTIVGATFTSKFQDVYNARQTLLNKIYQVTKDIADGKINTYYQETAPGTPHVVGDLWTKPSTKVTARWDGSNWVTAVAYVVGAFGGNLIPNPTFSSNRLGKPSNTPQPAGIEICDGWVVAQDTVGSAGFVKWVSGTGILCTINNPTVPANTTLYEQACLAEPIPVDDLAWYTLSMKISQSYNGTLGANITVASRVFVDWLDNAGAHISFSINTQDRSDPNVSLDVQAPSGAASAVVYVDTYVKNAGASAVAATSSTVALATTFRGVALVRKSDVEVAGSGKQIGDTRNLPPIAVGNGTAKVPTVVTWTAGTTTGTISVAAFTILSGSVSVSYGAKTVGVSGTSGQTKNYFLYIDDPTYSGTGTLVATTVGNAIYQGDGRIYVGSCSVTFSSGSSGSGDSGGGGSIGRCVCIDMWLSEHFMAAEAREGFVIDCLDLPVSDTVFQRKIKALKFSEEESVTIVTEGGAELDLSASTPFDLIDGRVAFASDMLGEIVVTDRGLEIVTEVRPIGKQPVARISVGGVSYAAGRDPKYRIFSHNVLKP